MQRIANVLIAGFLVAAAGCGTKAPLTPADYYSSAAYQSRELLEQSLFKSDQEVLGGEEIQVILESRIEIPESAHLAVLRLGSRREILGWSLFAPSLAADGSPLAPLASSSRIERISWLPSLLVPEKLTVPLLREAAARFQADLLLVFRTPCEDFRDYRWLRSDRARTYCVAEGILLDVRTGIIPLSSSSAQALEVEAREGDMTFSESTKRAEAEAIATALSQVASEFSDFFDELP